MSLFLSKDELLIQSSVKLRSAPMSFRLVRNLSLSSEGFPTPESFRDCGNDNLCGLIYGLLSKGEE